MTGVRELWWHVSVLAAEPPRPEIDRPVPPGQFNPLAGDGEALDLLNLLAWCMTAAAVGGLIIVGIQMAIQLNRGTPGEESDHFRGLAFIALACILGAAAGPIVSIFGDLGL
ncbi:hypothetical protein [Micromonospora fluostatini]|uniref:hypothetical protein n=1 Tax=Micromonospora sp. JCM 30529 TaxID=3421643 RepID=UPI003D1846EA